MNKYIITVILLALHPLSAIAAQGDQVSPIAVLLLLLIYFIPTIISMLRSHPNAVAIIVLNILAGWTGLGWLVSLIWSLLRIKENSA